MKKLFAILPLVLCFIISCQDKQAISELEELKAQAKLESDNKAVVRNWFEEGWNMHNLDKINEYFAPSYINYGDPDLNYEEWKKFVASVLTAFPDIHYTIVDQIAEGDKVVTRWTSIATHQGEFMGVPATGKKVTMTGINVSRHTNGKYVEDWGNSDALGLFKQLQGETSMK